MKWKSFTPEELVALRNNPYTLTASEKTVSFTLAFKEYMWQGLRAGKPADMLMREMGYDTAAFGAPRINGIAYHIRQEAQSQIGLHEGRQHLRNTKGLTEEEASIFAPSVGLSFCTLYSFYPFCRLLRLTTLTVSPAPASSISPIHSTGVAESPVSGTSPDGIVARILTNSPTHMQGIGVMLEDGRWDVFKPS